MAREIKTTPIIKGKDALNFYKNLEKNRGKVADKSVLQRIQQSVNYFNMQVRGV